MRLARKWPAYPKIRYATIATPNPETNNNVNEPPTTANCHHTQTQIEPRHLHSVLDLLENVGEGILLVQISIELVSVRIDGVHFCLEIRIMFLYVTTDLNMEIFIFNYLMR